MNTQENKPDQDTQQSEPGHGGRCHGRHHHCCGRRPWWAKLIVIAAIFGAIFAWHAYGHDRYCGFGHGFSRSFHEHDVDPARMREHAEGMTSEILKRVGATDAQRQKALAIARTAADDLQPLIAAHQAMRASLYSALTAETVDPARLEQLRTEMLQHADAVSRRMTQEIADMAAVLSATQRRELMAHWAPRLGA